MIAVSFLTWTFLVFWIFWYASVALERFNRDIYTAQVLAVKKKAESTSGLMYGWGLVVYAPYLYPIPSFLVWLVVVVWMLIFA